MSVTVTLTADEEIEAARIGFQRQRNAVAKHYPPRHRGGSLWGGHIEGACAEKAASKATGLPWTGAQLWEVPPEQRLADLGEKTEVRWVAPGKQTTLNFDAERDSDDRYYVLVSGHAPVFEIHGYIKGEFCRRPEWRVVYPERVVFRVPASALRPITARLAAA